MRAENLLSADSNGLSDPFVKIRVLDYKKDTRIVRKTLQPVWDEKFTFHGTLEQFQEESLELKLRDHDDGIADGDDDIGNVEVSLNELNTLGVLAFDRHAVTPPKNQGSRRALLRRGRSSAKGLTVGDCGHITFTVSFTVDAPKGAPPNATAAAKEMAAKILSDEKAANVTAPLDDGRHAKAASTVSVGLGAGTTPAPPPSVKVAAPKKSIMGSTKKLDVPGVGTPGTLVVLIDRAEHLLSADKNGLSDPFVKIRVLSYKEQTKVIRKTLDPVWNQTFHFKGTLEQFQADSLQLKVRDEDEGIADADDDIGTVEVSLSALILPIVTNIAFDKQPISPPEKQNTSHSLLRLGSKKKPKLQPGDCGHISFRVEFKPDKPELASAAAATAKDPTLGTPPSTGGTPSSAAAATDPAQAERDRRKAEIKAQVEKARLDKEAAEKKAAEIKAAKAQAAEKKAAEQKAAVAAAARGRSESALDLSSRGQLTVHLVRASDLIAADAAGTSDPYVKVRVEAGGKELKGETKVVKKTLNPAWDERISFVGVLGEFAATTLQLKLRDSDGKLAKDDDIGEVDVPLAGLRDPPHRLEFTQKVTPPESTKKKGGMLSKSKSSLKAGGADGAGTIVFSVAFETTSRRTSVGLGSAVAGNL